MWNRITSFFKRTTIQELPLEIVVDRDDANRYQIKILRVNNGTTEAFTNIESILNYGYVESSSDNSAIYVIGNETRQALLFLKSCNPDIDSTGTLSFDVTPLVPSYLRKKANVRESENARIIEISDEPIKPSALIDFDSAGIQIKTGYALTESVESGTSQKLLTDRAQQGFVLKGNTFFPVANHTDHRVRNLLDQGSVTIPLDNIPAFFNEGLPFLEKSFETSFTPNAKQVKVVNEPLKPQALVDFDPKQGLKVNLGYQLTETDHITPVQELDMVAEGEYVHLDNVFRRLGKMKSLTAQRWLEQGQFIIQIDQIPEFFTRDLVLLQKEFNAVLTDLAHKIHVIDDSFEPTVSIELDGKGWLEFHIEYETQSGAIPVEKLFATSRSSSEPEFIDGQYFFISQKAKHHLKRQLQQLGPAEIENGYRVPVSQFASLEEFVDAIGGQTELSQAYQRFLAQLTGFIPKDDFQLPEQFEAHLQTQNIRLRPYQRAGIHWLQWLNRNHLHGLLADDMGLGKTIMTICLLRLAYAHASLDPSLPKHSLIIAPKSVLHQWEREFSRCYPQMRTYRYHGANRRTNAFSSARNGIMFSTFDTVANDIQELSKIPFLYVVLDEATYIKNPSAKRTQAIKSLNAVYRLGLSGTPVENRPVELWSLFDFLMRGHLGSQHTFVNRFENSIIQGEKSTAEWLGKRIAPFMLRRTKENVAQDLPEKVVLTEWCELSTEQRTLYAGLQNEAKRIRELLQSEEEVSYTAHILPLINRLKQICDHPALVLKDNNNQPGRSEKFDWIVDKIVEIHGQQEQVVLFSQYLGMLDLLENSLNKHRISYIRIDGSTNNRERPINQFNAGNAEVALCSVRAAGYGINLTAANHVIHSDLWWNPAVEDQATDRVHRIGQGKTVYVYRILNENTLEQRINDLLEKKRDIADRIIGTALDGQRAWTKEELLEILRPLG